jgi:hypothetical protein
MIFPTAFDSLLDELKRDNFFKCKHTLKNTLNSLESYFTNGSTINALLCGLNFNDMVLQIE